MLLDWAFLIVAGIGFLAGWMSRWQWERRDPDNEWDDVFDRWDRS